MFHLLNPSWLKHEHSPHNNVVSGKSGTTNWVKKGLGNQWGMGPELELIDNKNYVAWRIIVMKFLRVLDPA